MRICNIFLLGISLCFSLLEAGNPYGPQNYRRQYESASYESSYFDGPRYGQRHYDRPRYNQPRYGYDFEGPRYGSRYNGRHIYDGPYSGEHQNYGNPHHHYGQMPPQWPPGPYGSPQYRPPMMPIPPPQWPPCYPFQCPPPGPPATAGPPAQTPGPPTPSASTASTSTGASGGTGGAGQGQTGSTTAAVSAGSSTTPSNAAGTSTATSSSGALSVEQRAAVLNVHNDLRSTLAKGTAANKTGTMPTGTNIVQLTYNTGLEDTAISWSRQCTFEHSSDSQRNGAGENLFWTSNLTIPTAQVLVDASNFWWKELVDFGIQASLNLTTTEFNKGIGHWSQMAWCSTARLGCGVNVCSNATYVVCHYSPAGNFINQLVYQPGTSCADCATQYGSGASCNATSSLCVLSS